jgi:hypothetical protein
MTTYSSGLCTTIAAEQKRASWRHCWLFLALLRNGNHGSSANNSRQQRWWRWHGQRYLGIVNRSLLARATPLIEAAWRTVHEDDSPSRRWCFSTIVSHPLPAHTTATIGVAQMNNGRAVPSLLHCGNDGGSTDKWRQSRRRCHGGIVGCSPPSCGMATMAAV